jgi:hypothetical protein
MNYLVLVGVIGVGASGCGGDPPCATEGCTNVPAAVCAPNNSITTYKGTCTSDGCEYVATTTSCTPQHYGCSLFAGAARCIDYEGGGCHLSGCPATRSSCFDATTLQVSALTCPPYPGVNCVPTSTTNSDCTTLVSPPHATCAGTVLTTYAATGSCFSNACGYAATSVDCATTNQVCNAATGACV